MSLRSWIRNLFARDTTPTIRNKRSRLSFEFLEDRWVPATFTVNNPTDSQISGETDLRQAVELANSTTGSNTIVFDPVVFSTLQTITLSGTQLELSNTSGTQYIQGPLAGVTVSGGGQSSVFEIDASVTASISGLTITGGNASNGGGMTNYGTVTLASCTVSNNSATGVAGGLDNFGTAALIDCIISGNTAYGYYGGGGVYSDGNITLTGCTISGNYAAVNGGGIYINYNSATITNCTVSGNTAGNSGGGLDSFYGSVTITNCTVSGNTAGNSGGGMYKFYNSVEFGSTIVAGNTATNSGPDASGTFASNGYNLIGETDGSSGWVGSDLTGTIAAPLNPLLAPLGNYGGPTQTMALLPGSPAIGTGEAQPGTTDERGLNRPSGASDIGAFQSGPLVVNSTADSDSFGSLTLRDAVAIANADSVSGTSEPITFDPTVFAAPQTITLTGGQLELSDTSGTESITGPAAGVTISGGGLSQVFAIDAGVTAAISGATLTDGYTPYNGGAITNAGNTTLTDCTVSGSAASGNGGGIYNQGTLALIDSTVSGNSAYGNGGGFYSYGGTIALNGCLVSGNTAAGGVGGGGDFVSGSTILNNCIFNSNTSRSSFGGGGVYTLYNTNTLTNCTISGNSSTGSYRGGGLYLVESTSTLNNCLIAGNSSNYAAGGVDLLHGSAIFNDCTISGNSLTGSTFYNYGGKGDGLMVRYATATLNDCTISGNYTVAGSSYNGGAGGGIYLSFYSNASLTNCTVSGNVSSTNGGGIFNDGSLNLTNCTLSGNSASQGNGGAIDNAGTMTATNDTIAQNFAFTSGGGLFTTGSTLVNGTIVAGNSDISGADDIDGYAYNTASSYNLIGIDNTGTLSQGVNGNQVGITAAEADLGPLASNGGPTETCALLPGSYALGMGVTSTTASTDERGIARPTGQPGDVGSVQLSAAPTVTTNPTNATIGQGGDASFSAAATDVFTDGITTSPTAVQWDVSTDGGMTFSPISVGGVYGDSVTDDTLTITNAPTGMSGDEFEAVFTNALGQSGTSAPATLIVNGSPSIASDPSNAFVLAGGTATFTASASGYPAPSAQWYINTGSGFTSLTDTGVYSGSSTDTLTITAATAAMNGYEYEAIFTNDANLSTATTSATLIVDFTPTVASNPTSSTIVAGGKATFAATASGNPTPSVQWYINTGNGNGFTPLSNGGLYSGAFTGALTITGVTAALNSDQYEAVFTNGIGSPVDSTPATLTVDTAPVVSPNPSDVTAFAATATTFTAAASGTPTPSAQWYVNEGSGFTALANGGIYSGTTTGMLSLSTVTPAMNGYEYEAVFSNGIGSPVTTTAAKLTVDYAPIVTSNPPSVTVRQSGEATFTAAASGYPAPSVQWYVNPGSGFTALSDGGVYSGSSTGTLTITDATEAMNGYQYEAVFTNSIGPSTSSPATLTVTSPAQITSSPTSVAIAAGGNTTFSAAASGSPAPGAQWYVNSGSGFSAIADGGVYSGSSTDALTITNATAAMNGYEYEAIFSNGIGSAAVTSSATLTVDYAPKVTTNPSNTTVTASSNATFSAAASGNPAPSAQWYVNSGSGFTPLSDGGVYSGSSTDTLTIAGVSTAMSGDEYEAVFTNGLSPAATSSPAILTVGYAPSVTSSPSSATVIAGGDSTFTASASGYPTPTVQWYVNTGTGFSAISDGNFYSGSTTGSLSITGATPAMNGYKYEAVFSNGINPTASTSSATLTVDSAPAITSDPTSVSIVSGDSTSFTASASGYPTPAIQWMVSMDGGATYSDASNGTTYSGANTDTLKVSGATAPMSGYMYEAVFTNTLYGETSLSAATSTAATLAVAAAGDPATSMVTVSTSSIEAGDSITVTLQAKGTQGNNVTSGGLTVAFGLQGRGGGQGTFSSVTDNNNGTYTAAFMGTTAGTNTITATIDGVPVTTTLPQITVKPGAASPMESTVSLSLSSVQLGGQTTIALQAKDAYGNKEIAGGQSVVFMLANSSGGAQGTIGSVTDNHNGTYTATFIGTEDGSNTVEAAISGSALTSTAALSVTGAAYSYAKSVFTVSSTTDTSGSDDTVTLQAEDAKGDKETSGGLSVAFMLGGTGGGQGTFGPVTDNDNGTYTAMFVGTVDGGNSIKAVIDGQTVTTKSPAVKVVTGQASPVKSLLTVSSSSVAAGGKATITLQPEDAAGNKVVSSNLDVVFGLGNSTGGQGGITAAKYNPNGTYTATFMGETAGGNTILATINGETVAASPIIIVTPGKASASESVVTVESVIVSAGTSAKVTLQAVDAEGNAETTGGLAVTFKLKSSSGAKGTFSKVTDNLNGTYTATFKGTIAGSNEIEAAIGGAAVASTTIISVTPGSLSLAESLVTLSASSVTPGHSVTIALQARDAEGNDLSLADLQVIFALANASGARGTITSAGYDSSNGTYTATFTATTAGANEIDATIGGLAVTSTPPTIKVT